MTEQPQPVEPHFVVEVPDDLTAGVYANIVSVWHSPYEFTLDFSVSLPQAVGTDETGNQVPVIPSRVVARVKIPPSAVFDLMRTLADNETRYVDNIGPIHRPGESGPPLYPPQS